MALQTVLQSCVIHKMFLVIVPRVKLWQGPAIGSSCTCIILSCKRKFRRNMVLSVGPTGAGCQVVQAHIPLIAPCRAPSICLDCPYAARLALVIVSLCLVGASTQDRIGAPRLPPSHFHRWQCALRGLKMASPVIARP